MKITNNKKSLKRILRYVDATIVLHNMLIDWNEAEHRNMAWDESVVTDLTSIDDVDRAPVLAEREVLDLPVTNGVHNDLCSKQLMRYICETDVTRYNYSPLHEEILLGDGDWSPIQGLEFSYRSDEDDSSTISELE
jgi:hypothetical protein